MVFYGIQRSGISILCLLLLSSQLISCALLSSTKPSEESLLLEEERRKLFKDELTEEIILGVRDVIRKEVLPDLTVFSPVSKRVLKKQVNARKAVDKKVVIGRIEFINFLNPSFKVKARVDSGAQTCSLHATKIKEKTINDELYVQFETSGEDDEKHVLLRKVIATRRVRSTTGDVDTRYVIREKITLGDRSMEININLNDRSKLRHRFLIGRNLLMGNYVIDIAQTRLLGR